MPTQSVRFASEQVEMIHIDVEGDGKQVISRIATDADKKQYAGAYGEFQQASGGAAAATQAAPQQQTQPGATGAPGQPPSPGTEPTAPSGATGQPPQPSGTNPPR